MNTQEAFQRGKDAALDALATLGDQFDGKHINRRHQAIGGALTTLITAVYAMAPSEEAAEELISFSQNPYRLPISQNKILSAGIGKKLSIGNIYLHKNN